MAPSGCLKKISAGVADKKGEAFGMFYLQPFFDAELSHF
jgi:hypothetical protein